LNSFKKKIRKFFTAKLIEINFANFLQPISWKKKFDIFSKKKKNFCHKKKGVTGEKLNNFSRKIRHDQSLIIVDTQLFFKKLRKPFAQYFTLDLLFLLEKSSIFFDTLATFCL
jgi:hypothetical protein